MIAAALLTAWISFGPEQYWRQNGDVAEVFVVQKENPNEANVFMPNRGLPVDIDFKKTSKDALLGTSELVGWPSFFPLFNRARVYHYEFFIKEKTK